MTIDPNGGDADRLAAIGLRVAGVFHDLRGLMNSVSGYAELMSQTDCRSGRMEHMERIWEQLEAVGAMTEEVLAYVRGDNDLFIGKVYLNRFLDQMAGNLIHDLAGSQIALRFDAKYVGVAYFDEPKIVRVVHNLVRNAAEAMDGRGQLELSTRADAESLYLELSDDGPGIPPELEARLFEPFTTGSENGTGLGLAICKRIVDQHRGDISVVSSTDAGTTFTVRLPALAGSQAKGPGRQAPRAYA